MPSYSAMPNIDRKRAGHWLITHRFPLGAYEEAYQVLRESSGPRGKGVLAVSTP
jgi:hypothetical protein